MVIKKKTLYAVYCASIMAMNVLAVKQFDLWIFTVTCGVLVSGILFVVQDYTTEIYGKKESAEMAITCYAISLVMIGIYQLAIIIKPSAFWTMQSEFNAVLKTTLRITMASVIAYAVGSLTNIFIMDKLKSKTNLFGRALASTVLGQLLDNGLFALIAFLGVIPNMAIVKIIFSGLALEVLTEIIIFPLLKATIRK